MSERKPVVPVMGGGRLGRLSCRTGAAREGWSVRRAVRSPEGSVDEVVIKSIGLKPIGRPHSKALTQSAISPRVHHK